MSCRPLFSGWNVGMCFWLVSVSMTTGIVMQGFGVKSWFVCSYPFYFFIKIYLMAKLLGKFFIFLFYFYNCVLFYPLFVYMCILCWYTLRQTVHNRWNLFQTNRLRSSEMLLHYSNRTNKYSSAVHIMHYLCNVDCERNKTTRKVYILDILIHMCSRIENISKYLPW